MTSRVRFPIVLTLSALAAFAICVWLGLWQMKRADWKTQELARIARLQQAPPQPLAAVLARAAQGTDVSLTRVAADCVPGPPPAPLYRMASDNGEWIARALAPCRLAGSPYDGILVDRGFLAASRGSTAIPTTQLPPPVHVVGVLFPRPKLPPTGLMRAAPYVIAAEAEAPPAPGVTPAPYSASADNLQYVGAYTGAWFGLAGVLACIYAAMLWRRYHPQAASLRT